MIITFDPQGRTAAPDLQHGERLVLDRGPLRVHARENFGQAEMPGGGRLLLWGELYALDNGSRVPAAQALEGFAAAVARHGLERAATETDGQFIGLMAEADGSAHIFADAFNRRELFYVRKGAALVASSSTDPLRREALAGGFSQEALASCFTMYGNYAPKRHTIFQAMRRLGVGESLKLGPAGAEVLTRAFSPMPTRQYQEGELTEYAAILRSAVARRGSETHNWLFMSSGFDSSTLLALLVERYGSGKVTGVIGRMRYSDRSGVINQFELDRAARIAAHYGVRLAVVDLDYTTPEAAGQVAGVAQRMRGHHLFLNSAYNFYTLAGFIAAHSGPADAVFAGEVSDAVHNLGFSQFASILEHPDLGFREYSDKMASYLFGPSFFGRALTGGCTSDLVFQIFQQRNGAENFLRCQDLSPEAVKAEFLASFFIRPRRVPFYAARSQALTANGAGRFDQAMRRDYLDEHVARLEPETLHATILHLYNSFHWQGATPRNMAASVRDLLDREVAMPFWDSGLHAFLSQAPENWGRGLELRPTKYPLKWMLEHELGFPMHLQAGPHSYLYDVNPQFSHTSEFLFGSALAPLFRDTLASRPYREILDPEWFDLPHLDGVVERYLAGEEFGGEDAKLLLDLVNMCTVGWSA